MISQVKYHYKMVRLPDDMTWDEFFVLYCDLKYIREQEAKEGHVSQLQLLSKLKR